MGTTITIKGRLDVSTVVPRTYTRANLADAWVEEPNLECTNASFGTSGSISEAIFRWEFGEIDDATVAPLDNAGRWVKVEWLSHSTEYDYTATDSIARKTPGVAIGTKVLELDTKKIFELEFTDSTDDASWIDLGAAPDGVFQVWHGVFTDSTKEIFPGDSDAGQQILTALGPEWILARSQVVDSVAADVNGVTDSVLRFKDSIPFNGGTGAEVAQKRLGGNQNTVPATMTQGAGTVTIQVFSNDSSNARRWNAKDIAEYLLFFHVPMEDSDFIWELVLPSSDVLAWLEPERLDYHGMTVLDILSGLINSRRSLVYWVVFDEDTSAFQVHVDTLFGNFAAPSIDPDGTTVDIPKNSDPIDIVNSPDAHVSSTLFKDSDRTRYDVVTVEGARRGAMLAVPLDGSILLPAWDPADETAYQAANEQDRRSLPRFDRVYTHFMLDPAWDGEIGGLPVFAAIEADGNTGGAGATIKPWFNAIRIEDYIPITLDGTNAPIDQVNQPTQHPLMFGEVVSGQVLFLDSLSALDSYESTDSHGFTFNVHVEAMADTPGIRLKIVGGPNHVIAYNQFDPTTGGSTDHWPKLDYRNFNVLVYMTIAERVRTQYPLAPTARYDRINNHVLRYGEKYYLDDFHAEGGVAFPLGFTEEGIDGKIRDSRGNMQVVARMSYEWYKNPRKMMNLDYDLITGQVKRGQFIETLDSFTDVNSTISMIGYDFTEQKTKIRTMFSEAVG